MRTTWTPERLIAFEEDIAAEFNAGKIKAPVHLYSGGEAELIAIFENIRPQDWVLCSWRSHYQCLLKGVPPEELKAKILAGNSIALSFPEYRVLSSAIVGGVLPIAVGLGIGIKRRGTGEQVHAFMGDMTSLTGDAHVCMKYAANFNLPVRFHIEDNGLSVLTETRKVWGIEQYEKLHARLLWNTDYFRYTATKYPHAGGGVRVQF
jgi:TPP-dependent pyruvate/acetoin dehydrogenase alpha subunit